jgi:membrane associated rhomboid family serine protease
VVIPVYDEHVQTLGLRPWVMWIVLILNVIVLLYLWLLPDELVQALAYNFGVVPAFITGAVSLDDIELVIPPLLTLATYTFMHGNWLHLTGNMIFLWVFGDNVEAAMGHARFILFYLLCGIAGGLTHVGSEPGSVIPLVGASGAVAGVLAAYLMLWPRVHITVLVLGLMTVRVHAYWLLGAWIVWQVLNVLLASQTEVSYWSHVGGLIAGAGLVVVLRRPGVKLFQGPIAWRKRITG